MQIYKDIRLRARVAAAVLVVATVVLGQNRVVLAAPQCPVVRFDAQCTGYSSVSATYDPAKVWSLGTTYSTMPVIGTDGSLYLGNGYRNLRSYSTDGTLKWVYNTPSSISGSAALGSDGSIYVALTGQLVALLNDGTSKWASPYIFTCGCTPSPVIIDKTDTLYFGADDKNVYAVNSDGTSKWYYATGGIIRYSCAVSPDGSTVYATSGDGRVYAINASDGTLKWKTSAISSVYNCAVADDGTVYVGSTNGKLYAFAPDGTQKWTFQSQSKVTCAPTVGPDGTVYFGSQDANLYALDENGNMKWRYRTGGPIYSTPTIDSDGTVIFGAWPGTLTALNSLDGTIDWTRALTSISYNPVLIDNEGSIYTLTNDGVLTKFSGPHTPEPSSLAALGSMFAIFGVKFRKRRNPIG